MSQRPTAYNAAERFQWNPEKTVKKSKVDLEDDLRKEYNFHALRLIARGPGRKKPAETTVSLASDVAAAFPNSEAVNEALRFLMRITEKEVGRRS